MRSTQALDQNLNYENLLNLFDYDGSKLIRRDTGNVLTADRLSINGFKYNVNQICWIYYFGEDSLQDGETVRRIDHGGNNYDICNLYITSKEGGCYLKYDPERGITAENYQAYLDSLVGIDNSYCFNYIANLPIDQYDELLYCIVDTFLALQEPNCEEVNNVDYCEFCNSKVNLNLRTRGIRAGESKYICKSCLVIHAKAIDRGLDVEIRKENLLHRYIQHHKSKLDRLDIANDLTIDEKLIKCDESELQLMDYLRKRALQITRIEFKADDDYTI